MKPPAQNVKMAAGLHQGVLNLWAVHFLHGRHDTRALPQTGASSAMVTMDLAAGRASKATIHRTKHAGKANRTASLRMAKWQVEIKFSTMESLLFNG